MKVIVDAQIPFAWAHGGMTILVQEVVAGLRARGVDVDYCRWWDQEQKSDIYLGFGPLTLKHTYARQKGIAVVNYMFLDSFTRRNQIDLWLRAAVIRASLRLARNFVAGLGWDYARIADASVYPSDADAQLARQLFGAPLNRARVILHGVAPAYLAARQGACHDQDYLLSVSTIHPRKNSLLLARLARASRTPVRFVGKPYAENDPYFREFLQLVDGKYVCYEGFIEEERKIELLRNARGFVLFSQQESGCIAVLEAFATGCPVLLPKSRWANPLYAGHATLCSLTRIGQAAAQLRAFYDAPPVRSPFPVQSWPEVAGAYANVCEEVLSHRLDR
jgi:glycosyltransferase involved in cell wall biosynthesis